jgi:hypothetical protein
MWCILVLVNADRPTVVYAEYDGSRYPAVSAKYLSLRPRLYRLDSQLSI